jgi:hypothetical protein
LGKLETLLRKFYIAHHNLHLGNAMIDTLMHPPFVALIDFINVTFLKEEVFTS